MKNSYIKDRKERTDRLYYNWIWYDNSFNKFTILHSSSFLTISNTLRQFPHLKRNIFMTTTIEVGNSFKAYLLCAE